MNVDKIVMDDVSIKLKNAIEDASRRQAVYSYNVANASTPGFKPVRFDDELQKAQARYGEESKDFNLEEEMAKIAMNNMRHSALTKIFSTRYQILKKVLTGGKG